MSDATPNIVNGVMDSDVQIGDPLSIEARIARIEDMAADTNRMIHELYDLAMDAKPAIDKVRTDVESQGIAGLLGSLMPAMMGMRRQ